MMIMNALSIITRYGKVFFDRKLSEVNVSFTEHFVIMFLNGHDSVNQDTIAKYFMIDKGAIAKTLNHLEEKGYILRTDNPTNKREKIITITEKGQSIIGFMQDELQEWDNQLFDGISEEDSANFKRIALLISDNATNLVNGRQVNDEKSE